MFEVKLTVKKKTFSTGIPNQTHRQKKRVTISRSPQTTNLVVRLADWPRRRSIVVGGFSSRAHCRSLSVSFCRTIAPVAKLFSSSFGGSFVWLIVSFRSFASFELVSVLSCTFFSADDQKQIARAPSAHIFATCLWFFLQLRFFEFSCTRSLSLMDCQFECVSLSPKTTPATRVCYFFSLFSA